MNWVASSDLQLGVPCCTDVLMAQGFGQAHAPLTCEVPYRVTQSFQRMLMCSL